MVTTVKKVYHRRYFGRTVGTVVKTLETVLEVKYVRVLLGPVRSQSLYTVSPKRLNC